MKKKVLQQNLSTLTNKKLFQFTQSIDIDSQLYQSEIKVQKAWCESLFEVKIFSEKEFKSIYLALTQIENEMKEGEFHWQLEDEDIHMNIERALTEKLGDLGKKIHLGRSRNDLIATTLRLFLKDELQNTSQKISILIKTLIEHSKNWSDIITPGLTHQQFGQPVRFSHILSAHGWALLSDLKRIKCAQIHCMDYMPLGSAALAGTHLRLDLINLSQKLGFTNPPMNSYFAVGDRGFILEALSAYALHATQISRLCEELIFWSQTSIGVLQMPYDWSTGSSIMPNKRNPDVLELIRAKMARVISNLQEGLIIVKSVLPSYGSDFSEFKRTYFSSQLELNASLDVLIEFIKNLKMDKNKAESLLNKGHLLATDCAHLFVEEGLPFREAYSKTSQLVQESEEKGKQVHETLQSQTTLSLNFLHSVELRSNNGGTALISLLNSLDELENQLNEY